MLGPAKKCRQTLEHKPRVHGPNTRHKLEVQPDGTNGVGDGVDDTEAVQVSHDELFFASQWTTDSILLGVRRRTFRY